MPGTIRLSALIEHLDDLLSDLSLLWSDCKNFETLALIETMAEKIERIIKTLKSLE
jgi:hypothetical protein